MGRTTGTTAAIQPRQVVNYSSNFWENVSQNPHEQGEQPDLYGTESIMEGGEMVWFVYGTNLGGVALHFGVVKLGDVEVAFRRTAATLGALVESCPGW